jgi:predicted transcriptional regulator
VLRGLALLAVLLLAALAAQARSDETLTVPVGRLGDEVEYDIYAVFETMDDGVRRVREEHSREALRADEITTIADAAGRMHEVLVWTHASGGDFAKQYPALRGNEYVALDGRALIRFDDVYLYGEGTSGFRAHYAPSFVDHGWHWQRWREHRDLRFQGETYRVGQPVPQPAGQQEDWKPWFANIVQDERVAASGRVNGEPAVRIHWYREYDEVVHVHDEISTWVGSATPYYLYRNGSTTHTWPGGYSKVTISYRLAEYRPGAGPEIPWREILGAPDIRRHDAERTTTGFAPGDGSARTFPYSFEEAVRHVESNPALRRFQAWRADHPHGVVVGANYLVGAAQRHFWDPILPEAPVASWTLLWGDVDGSSIAVRSSRGSGVVQDVEFESAVVATDWSDYTSIQQAFEVMQPGAVTWWDAARLWTRLREDPEAGPLTYGQWGFAHVGYDGAIMLFGGESRLFEVIELAHGNPQTNVLGQRINPAERAWSSVAVMHAQTGLMHTMHGLSDERPLTLAPLGEVLDAPRIEVDRQPSHFEAEEWAGGIAALGLLAVLAWIAPLLKHWITSLGASVAGYAKVPRESALDHPLRRTIVEAVAADPGITPPELQRLLDARWSTLIYHLSVLERHRMVASVVRGRRRHMFPAAQPMVERRKASLLRNPRTKTVLECIGRDPGIGRGELARQLDLSLPGLDWHIRRLTEAGMVRQERAGLRHVFHPVAA